MKHEDIYCLLKNLGITQQQLSEVAGICQSSISKKIRFGMTFEEHELITESINKILRKREAQIKEALK